MEYYLAVRMRRFGRAFQPTTESTSTPDRGPERPVGLGAHGGSGPVVAGVSTATRVGDPGRPMSRPTGRQGRF
jgi:hypothetical protein